MSRPNDPGAHDADRDAWLREALRHAPDAELQAPPALREAILREAEAKARTPARQAPRRAPPRWWDRLAQPAAGAALASVMLATVIGLIWFADPLPPDVPAADARMSEPVEIATGEAAADAASPAPPPPAAAAERTARPAAVPPAHEAAPAAQKAAPRGEPAAERRVAGDLPRAGLPAPAPAAPGEAPEPDAAAGSSHEMRAAAMAPSTWSELRAAITADRERWSWRRAGEAARPLGEPLIGWLAQADAADAPPLARAETADRRHAAAASARTAPSTTGAAAPPAARAPIELHLLHDGRLRHTLRIDGNAVIWDDTDPATPPQRLVVDAARADALRAAAESLPR